VREPVELEVLVVRDEAIEPLEHVIDLHRVLDRTEVEARFAAQRDGRDHSEGA
jgi:hypothetical protein